MTAQPAPGAEARAPGLALGAFMVLMTLAGWSSIPLFLKHFSHAVDQWTSNGWRYGFSALLWAPVLVAGVARRRLPGGIWTAALVPAVFNVIGQVCFTWAHYKIEPGLLTFGMRLQIVFVGLGAYLLFENERRVIRSPGYLLGAALVLAGTVGVVFLGPQRPEGATGFGVLLAIASGLFFACYGLSVRRFMHGMHPVVAFAAISQYTALAMVLLMLGLGERSGAAALDMSGRQMFLFLLSAVIGIALGHVFYYASIARLGVAVTAGVIQLQPFLVTAFSHQLYGEVLTAGQLTSGVGAILGASLMLTVQWSLGRAAARSKAPAAPAPEADEIPLDGAACPEASLEPAGSPPAVR